MDDNEKLWGLKKQWLTKGHGNYPGVEMFESRASFLPRQSIWTFYTKMVRRQKSSYKDEFLWPSDGPDFNFEDVLYASGKGASGWRNVEKYVENPIAELTFDNAKI
ncbi:hypothetical protein V6N11_073687 [Hibiscus sabdariffa]|uniref:Uncharacterized protein n=2 Tax=Hibiscus sabdariffa TaxID=183260 RepID=A0ABR2NUP3_9ROSI